MKYGLKICECGQMKITHEGKQKSKFPEKL
jgi:hypothetical protein